MSNTINKHHKHRIIVGMSGGVDSSVAALLLNQKNHHVSGLFMKSWEEYDPFTDCPAAIDAADAFEVCDTIGIAFDAINFSKEYEQRVFQNFLDEYRQGRTPNPDILCNREIKFKAFLDYAIELGADQIATGHYARIEQHGSTFCLLKGLDNEKDQSYFLHALNQHQLSKTRFPLGELNKSRVREIALKYGFQNHGKKDSTGICFIGERRFKAFLNQYLPSQVGVIRTVDGEIIGSHDGQAFHTIGQRKGLQIGGRRGDTGEPWYVVTKKPKENEVIVAQGHDHPMLYHDKLTAIQIHWIAGEAPPLPLHCKAKIRYRQADQDCLVDNITRTSCTVTFDKPQRAITPGQSIVFYQGEYCLGGAVINDFSDAGHKKTAPYDDDFLGKNQQLG